MAAGANELEWLLHEDEAERIVPVSDRITIDDDYWRATIHRFHPADGLRIALSTAEVHREVVFETHQAEPEPWLFSNVPIAGDARLSVAGAAAVELSPARSAVYMMPAERRAVFSISPQPSLRHATYGVRADRVRHMFGEDLPERIASAIEDDRTSRPVEMATTAGMRRVAASLFTRRLEGPLRLIFMEGVALQLLALQAAAGASRKRRRALSPRVRHAIEEAHAILLADVAKPPSLGALSAAVGISERALNTGFRQLYHATVYEVLRDARLEQARIVLESGAAEIKQVAYRVGYRHVSNFSLAFARRFGAPPRQYAGSRSRKA